MRSPLFSLLVLAGLFACSESPRDPVLPAIPYCRLDAQVGCVARTEFPSASKANITANAGNVKAGNTFGGVAGTLALCAADNGINCIASAEFPSVVKANLSAGTVVSGSTLAGLAGTFAPPCTSDGAVDCLTTTTFKAVNLASLTTWDVRVGKTVGGVTGSSTLYTSAATLSTFNRAAGTASSADTFLVDNYDTIDDNANNLAIPSGLVAGAPQFVSNWVRDTTSDTDADQSCNGSEACVYNDLLTGLSWLSDNNMTYLWEAAIAYCEGLNIAGHEDWRLPTQKELMQAYVNRIFSLKTPMGLVTTEYYSATTVSAIQLNAWSVTLGTGVVSSTRIKGSDSNHVLCVR